jgi:hypothetical protein
MSQQEVSSQTREFIAKLPHDLNVNPAIQRSRGIGAGFGFRVSGLWFGLLGAAGFGPSGRTMSAHPAPRFSEDHGEQRRLLRAWPLGKSIPGFKRSLILYSSAFALEHLIGALSKAKGPIRKNAH